MCSRFACTPHQLRSWLRCGKDMRILSFQRKLPRPIPEDDAEQSDCRPKKSSHRFAQYSVSIRDPRSDSMEPPPVIGSIRRRNGRLTNEVEFPAAKQALGHGLLELLKADVSSVGACSSTDSMLASRLGASRSATQEVLARLIKAGKVVKQGGRRRVLSFEPLALEALLKFRPKASRRRGWKTSAPKPRRRSLKRRGRPRKNPIRFTLPEVKRAIVLEFSRREEPAPATHDIQLCHEDVLPRVERAIAQSGDLHTRHGVLTEVAFEFVQEQLRSARASGPQVFTLKFEDIFSERRGPAIVPNPRELSPGCFSDGRPTDGEPRVQPQSDAGQTQKEPEQTPPANPSEEALTGKEAPAGATPEAAKCTKSAAEPQSGLRLLSRAQFLFKGAPPAPPRPSCPPPEDVPAYQRPPGRRDLEVLRQLPRARFLFNPTAQLS